MTYGVYTKDLKAQSLGGVSLETARRYKHEGDVICEEKPVYVGFSIRVIKNNHWGFGYDKWSKNFYIGPISIRIDREWYLWAGKVVEE